MTPQEQAAAGRATELHSLKVRCGVLEGQLAKARQQAASAQAAAEDERRTLTAELNRRGDSIAKMGLDNVNALNMVRQHAAALVETLKALRRVLAAIDQCDRCRWDARSRDVLNRIMLEGRAAISKHDVPFGQDDAEARDVLPFSPEQEPK